MLTHINFERLKTFYFIYHHRGILNASRSLHVTRSAVSQSLKALETDLGLTLFIRDSKTFRPTQEADRLFATINPFMMELLSTLKNLQMELDQPLGHLRIGAPLDFGSGPLTRIIGKFRRKFPQVTFELMLAVPIKQLEALTDGKLDIAFIDNGDVHAERFPVSLRNVTKEEFVLAASDRLRREFGMSSLDREKLSELPFVDYLQHAPVAQMWIKHHFGKTAIELNVVYSAESVRAVLTALAEDIGVGIVPKHLLVGEFKHLHAIETARSPFINQIMMARSLGRRSSAREKAFVEFFKEEFKG